MPTFFAQPGVSRKGRVQRNRGRARRLALALVIAACGRGAGGERGPEARPAVRVGAHPATRPAAAGSAPAAPAAPAAPDGAPALVVDSRMTREQAVLAGLAPGCPPAVARRQRVVDVEYPSFDGRLHRGQLVVDESLVEDVQAAFAEIRAAGFPVTSVIPISAPAFGWSDDASMAADNTSGFNYRTVAGTTRLSRHACGRAFDLNPRRNPFFQGRTVQPPGATYDPRAAGTLSADHPVVRRMKALGWTWGGDWRSPRDYQHFEKGGCP